MYNGQLKKKKKPWNEIQINQTQVSEKRPEADLLYSPLEMRSKEVQRWMLLSLTNGEWTIVKLKAHIHEEEQEAVERRRQGANQKVREERKRKRKGEKKITLWKEIQMKANVH